MISFANDYSEGAHPRILEMMGRANLEQNDGYGLDAHSEKARQNAWLFCVKNSVCINLPSFGKGRSEKKLA